VEGEGRVEGWSSYLFELQLGPPASVGIGVEGGYYATSNGGGIHLVIKMYIQRRECVICLEAGEQREAAWVGACVVVRLLCGLRLRCGAVGEQEPLIEDAPNKQPWDLTKIFGGQKRQAGAGQGPQRGSGNQLQYRSKGLRIRDTDSTVEAECSDAGFLFWASASALPSGCLPEYQATNNILHSIRVLHQGQQLQRQKRQKSQGPRRARMLKSWSMQVYQTGT
jgi:hypothetical protein